MNQQVEEILRDIPVFRGLNPDEIAKLVPYLEYVTFPPGVKIIQQGTLGNSMFIIKSGAVRVSRIENETEIFLKNLYKGSYFGELSLIDKLPRSADVISIEEVEIFRLKRDDFNILITQDMNIANKFYRYCLLETFSRFRNVTSNFTFSQHILQEKSDTLDKINKDLSYAKKVQDYFIDADSEEKNTCKGRGINYSHVYRPCMEIGGDFLNISELDANRDLVVIADIEGHGITAALATGVMKSALSIIADKEMNVPSEITEFLNQHFIRVINRLYATGYIVFINREKRKISFSRAGHHPPLFWKHKEGRFIEIECPGPGIGIIPDAFFGDIEESFDSGDKIFFYTDGIIEQADSSGKMYGQDRLIEKFKNLILNNEKNVVDSIYNDLVEYAGTDSFEDDVTLLLIEFE